MRNHHDWWKTKIKKPLSSRKGPIDHDNGKIIVDDLFDELENAHYSYADDLEDELLCGEQEKYFLEVQNV